MSKSLVNYYEITSMILLTPRINWDIINKHDKIYVKIRLKYSVHQVHESCRIISQAKRHNKKLVMTITSPKCFLRDVTFSYSQLKIARSEVYLRKASGTLKLIKYIINPLKRILIIYNDHVPLAVINTHPKRTIFLSHK
ncbi:hypothetical protein R3W88_001221 [Solanum pinnatisectum]|uniref:Uncharacterized protein n=1 Tax=Solanum pinnatisectum TaxID=50273 RepID=A0AAV9MKI0_9SOLN|nr:hypothetical protein R3W88_001221 [Solanum pinnatisectum]